MGLKDFKGLIIPKCHLHHLLFFCFNINNTCVLQQRRLRL